MERLPLNKSDPIQNPAKFNDSRTLALPGFPKERYEDGVNYDSKIETIGWPHDPKFRNNDNKPLHGSSSPSNRTQTNNWLH
jgi:hypothetical protein